MSLVSLVVRIARAIARVPVCQWDVPTKFLMVVYDVLFLPLVSHPFTGPSSKLYLVAAQCWPKHLHSERHRHRRQPSVGDWRPSGKRLNREPAMVDGECSQVLGFCGGRHRWDTPPLPRSPHPIKPFAARFDEWEPMPTCKPRLSLLRAVSQSQRGPGYRAEDDRGAGW